MLLRKGTITILCAVGLGGSGLLLAGFFKRDQLIDSWYIHRLGSEDREEIQAAAGKLFERGSVRAIPALVRLAASLERRGASLPSAQTAELESFSKTIIYVVGKLVSQDPSGSLIALRSLLKDESPDICRIALNLLLPRRDMIHLVELVPWLDAETGGALQVACYLLYSSGAKAIPVLEETARAHAAPHVRRNAADLLEALRR